MNPIIFSLAMMTAFSTVSEAKEFKPNYEAKIDAKAKEVKFNFVAGQVQIRYEEKGDRNDVKCELDPNTPPKSQFNFGGEYEKFRCEITLSRDIKVTVKGKDGQIQATNLPAETHLSLENGQIQFTGNANKKYDYDASVENGMKPMLPMSASKGGHPVKVELRVKSGMISVQ
jgi:hypothetical protein